MMRAWRDTCRGQAMWAGRSTTGSATKSTREQDTSNTNAMTGDETMPDRSPSYFTGHNHYTEYFKETHAAGALDAKTKELMHLALVLAYHCEP